jgi:hypothetical protein
MTELNIPDYMPELSRGAHNSPQAGACVMEMVAFLAGESHSDKPQCADTGLRGIAINVNDSVADTSRNRISALIHRFMGTSDLSRSGDSFQYNMWSNAVANANSKIESIKMEFSKAYSAGFASKEELGKASEAADNKMINTLVSAIDTFDAIFKRTQAVQIDLNLTKAHPSQVKVNA